MRKVIAAINMTLDGNCDHNAGIPNEALHWHYTKLMYKAGALLYGRVTFQLMEFWPTLLREPSGNEALDEFAKAIDSVPKVVFSRTLTQLEWASARLATRGPEEEIKALKAQPGKDIYIGSPGLIVSMLNAGLVDELQLCIHPVVAGGGMMLFKDIAGRQLLRLTQTQEIEGGFLVLHYQPIRE